MCPVYDLLNHDHAGLNTAGAVQGQVFSIGTTASVDKGGQLFNLFGPNNVANIFRDYGFLPSYPRVWELAVPYPAGDKRDKHDRGMGSRSEAVLFVFEEMEDKRIDLYPLQSTRLKVDRSTMATAFKNHLTEVQRQSSVLNAALLANKTTVSTHIHKAKWFRVQYTLAFARALHTAESTTYNQQNDNNNNDRQKTPIKKQKVKKRRKLPKDDL